MKLHGYTHVPGTAGIWKHSTRQTTFCLCVDDLAIKYYNQDDLTHLINSISSHYKYHIDTTGTHYMGLTLKWNYDKQYVDISIPGYVPKLLKNCYMNRHQNQSLLLIHTTLVINVNSVQLQILLLPLLLKTIYNASNL